METKSGRNRWLRTIAVVTAIVLTAAACGGDGGGEVENAGTGDDPSQGDSGAEQGVTGDTIRIGAFGPLDGPASWIGLGARDGLKLALSEINAHGGINGREVELLFENADSPAESLAAAKKLVEGDKVYVLVIGGGSTGAAAVADYARQNSVPTYNILGATPAIREPFAKHVFHGTAASAGDLAGYLVEQVAKLDSGPERVAVLSGTYEYPTAVAAGALPQIEELGLEVVSHEKFDLGDKDFTAQLTNIARSEPDAILFLGHFTEGALALKQAGEGRLRDVPWVVDSASAVGALPSAAGETAEGTRSYFVMPYFHGADDPDMQQFEAAWRELHGSPPEGRPNYVDLAGYGDMYVLAYVIDQAGDDLSWENLVSTWESIDQVVPTDFGSWAADIIFPESFSPDNHQGNRCHATIEVQDGIWTVIDTACSPDVN